MELSDIIKQLNLLEIQGKFNSLNHEIKRNLVESFSLSLFLEGFTSKIYYIFEKLLFVIIWD